MNENDSGNVTTKDIILRGSLIAIIVTIPSLTSFGISWYLLDNLMNAIIIGAIVHFIAMGFSFKISKKFFIKNSTS